MLVILCVIEPARAEYRAFELAIINSATGQERTVLSTLDHIQYPEYYPLYPNETVQYKASWMCYGNTSGEEPICPRRPASSPESK